MQYSRANAGVAGGADRAVRALVCGYSRGRAICGCADVRDSAIVDPPPANAPPGVRAGQRGRRWFRTRRPLYGTG